MKQTKKPKIKRKKQEKKLSSTIKEIKKAEIDIAKKDKTEAIIPDASNLEKLGKYLLQSNLFPSAKNIAGIITIIEYGRELKLLPVQALQTMSIIKGRLCIESKALLALAISKGIKHKILKHDEKICQIEFKREGFDPHIETFTSEDAKRAELTAEKKDNWKHFPKQMMLWRCVANGIRTYCPDLALGLYSKEELEDAPTLEAQIVSGEIKEAEEVKETQARTEEDKEKQELVNNIKYKLLKLEIDVKEFKVFLETFQISGTKEQRLFVSYKFGNLSLTEGKLSDLKLLWQNFDYVVSKFYEWKKEKEEKKEELLQGGLMSEEKELKVEQEKHKEEM
jgi:hypothetical protein